MASPGSPAAHLPSESRRSPRTSLLVRLCAFLGGPSLDPELAQGISPTASILLGARADWITRPRACQKVAQALRGAVEAAERLPDRRRSTRVPLEADAIQACRDDALALAETLATVERPSSYGVAIARQLAFDGRSPLYLQAPDRRQGAELRLTWALNAAQRALDVSADFDCLSASPSSTREEVVSK